MEDVEKKVETEEKKKDEAKEAPEDDLDRTLKFCVQTINLSDGQLGTINHCFYLALPRRMKETKKMEL
uniref:Uncharacterized protein n=1 Tax=Setaria digitata TaxID=48799 RepID=A0A915Q039_9BILA